MSPTVAVVGAGISGLAAAWEVAGAGAHVLLLEADQRAGGKLRTAPFAGRPVELGPDAFLARRPEAVSFVRELGLGADLVSPAAAAPYLWLGDELKRLPEGLLLGLPSDLARGGPLRGALPPRPGPGRRRPGAARSGPHRADPDPAVGALVRRRLGREAHERLVDPLLGGINAGDSDRLSLRLGVPQLATAVTGHRSLILAAWAGRRRQRRAPGGDGPVFHSVRGGLGRLAERALRGVAERGGEVVLGFAADRLDHKPDGTWTVVGPTGARFSADALVLALPSAAAATLLEPHAPACAGLLAGVETASVAMVLLAYPEEAVGRALDGSGFLVPRSEGRLVTACSWASTKWPDWASPGTALLRVSVGRQGDGRALALGDDDLVRRIHTELAGPLRLSGPPATARVVRWPDSFPQYAPGHADLVRRIRAAAPSGVTLCGATYEGVGIPACIGSGRRAGARAAAFASSRAATLRSPPAEAPRRRAEDPVTTQQGPGRSISVGPGGRPHPSERLPTVGPMTADDAVPADLSSGHEPLADLVTDLLDAVGTLTELVTATARADARHLAAMTAELQSVGVAVEALAREMEVVKRSARREVTARATLSVPDLDALATAVVAKLQSSFRVVGPGTR